MNLSKWHFRISDEDFDCHGDEVSAGWIGKETENAIFLDREDKVEQGEFKAGGIHKEENVMFWRDVLKADSWVMDTLRGGYVLPFVETPPESYEEDNNASARQDMEFVRNTVRKWADQGVVKILKEKPNFVSPLTVAARHCIDGSIKKRLCWDGSRCVNKLLAQESVSLSHLQNALELTEKGDLQCKYDLKSAYFHIKIHEHHVKYLGAKFMDEKGEPVYFCFLFMPFGLSSAVRCMTKLFKPIVAYLSSVGIRHTIFIDDGRSLSRTKEDSQREFQTTLDIISKAGWIIEISKTVPIDGGSTVMEYLGFIIDSEQMSVSLTQEKINSIRQSVADVVQSRGHQVGAKTVAKMLGKMSSAEPALGPFSLIMARLAYGELDKVVQERGWRATLRLSDEAIASLQDFFENFEKFNGYPIRSAGTAVSVMSILGPPSGHMKTSVIPNHIKSVPEEIWCGDASDYAVCAYSIKSTKNHYFIGRLSNLEMSLSSGHRELLTVKYALQAHLSSTGPWETATTLYWVTDSSNLVAFLTKGSSKTPIQKEILEVLCIAKQLRIRIVPIHLLREDPRIKVADAGSKCPDTDDWSIDPKSFGWIQNNFEKFTIDLFADESNHKVERFYSNFLCPSSLGIDAFCHSWDNEVSWICPPVNLIIHVIRKIKETHGKGVLVVPQWPTARFWPILFPKGKLAFPFFRTLEFQPTILQNQRARSMLAGRVPFSFIACLFDQGTKANSSVS